MAHIRLADLAPGQQVAGDYRLRQCHLRSTPQGRHFILGELQDASGQLGFVSWHSTAEEHEQLRTCGYARVEGQAESYRDRLQIVVQHLAPRLPEQIDLDLIEAPGGEDREALLAELDTLIASLDDVGLRSLLDALLRAEPVRRVAFATAPAALSMHHARPGGLLAHSLAVARLADDACRRYPRLDRDLLVSAALLHDLGKIEELQWQGTADYTTRGNLLGHAVIATMLIEQLGAGLSELPQPRREHLQHLILSHHGRHDWGAAREPMSAEALVLHGIDFLDAHLDGFYAAIDGIVGQGAWTEFNKMFGRRLWRGDGGPDGQQNDTITTTA